MAGSLGLVAPLRIVNGAECVKVVDAVGVVASYVYVCDDEDRRQQTHRMTTAQGIEAARITARALTAKIEAGG